MRIFCLLMAVFNSIVAIISIKDSSLNKTEENIEFLEGADKFFGKDEIKSSLKNFMLAITLLDTVYFISVMSIFYNFNVIKHIVFITLILRVSEGLYSYLSAHNYKSFMLKKRKLFIILGIYYLIVNVIIILTLFIK